MPLRIVLVVLVYYLVQQMITFFTLNIFVGKIILVSYFMINKYHNGFLIGEYGVHISKQNANKIYKLLWTHSFEMVLFLPFFSLSPHNDCIIFLSFADHRRVRLCLFQNGLRHRITLYPPSRKVSFLFCFAFCVYVHVFSRPYTWSQYS